MNLGTMESPAHERLCLPSEHRHRAAYRVQSRESVCCCLLHRLVASNGAHSKKNEVRVARCEHDRERIIMTYTAPVPTFSTDCVMLHSFLPCMYGMSEVVHYERLCCVLIMQTI
jgi:hypothetical protein